MRLLGPAFVISFYYLMLKHTWVYLTIICTVLRGRLGSTFATIWTMIGIVITFNVVWNHVLAMCLKPGGPKDLQVSNILIYLIPSFLPFFVYLLIWFINNAHHRMKNYVK